MHSLVHVDLQDQQDSNGQTHEPADLEEHDAWAARDGTDTPAPAFIARMARMARMANRGHRTLRLVKL